MPSTRIFAIFCGGSFALLLIVGWGGNILQASGIIGDPRVLRIPFLVVMIGLLAVFTISAIPLMVGAVLGFQKNVGNENVPVIRSAISGRNVIVYVLWGLMALGTAVAIPAAVRDGALGTLSTGSTPTGAPMPSEGTLVAAPGMTFTEMAQQSSLKIDIQSRAPITSSIGAGAVFDYRVAGTQTVFRNCRYYFVSPYTQDADRIESINVGLSPHTVSREELHQANAALKTQLEAGGWRAGHEEFRTEEDRVLHGGATGGPEGTLWLKNDLVLSIGARRMDDPVPEGNAQSNGKWIQFIQLWKRNDYPGIERYRFAPLVH